MMVDYGLLPPEINSARIYAGPGAESLVAAAAAWAGLAADLQDSVAGHRSVITTLTSGPWTGPAAASALASVSPFITWLDISAEEAAHAGPRVRGHLTASADDAAVLVQEDPCSRGWLRHGVAQTSGGGLEKRMVTAPPRQRKGP